MKNIVKFIIYILVGMISCIIYNFGVRKISKKINKINFKDKLILLCLIVYLSLLFSFNISPIYGFSSIINWNNNLNLNPLNIIDLIKNRPLESIKNISIFIPMGVLIPLINKNSRNFYKAFFISGFISLSIEVFQLFLYKKTDINHLIFSVIGTIVGFLIYKLIIKIDKLFFENDLNLISYYNKSIYLYGVICVIFVSVIITGFVIKHEETQVQGSNVYLIDADTDYVIYDKESNEKVAPASTTKMITALTVLDYCNINEKVVVGDEIKYVYADASRAGLKKGNVLTIKQLLDGLLLPSGNDSAYVLAKYTGNKILRKKVETRKAIAMFVKAINEKAKSIGATNSNFLRPDGYDKKGQYTTASDLACIAKCFMKNKVLIKIASKYKVDDVFLDGSRVTYENTNQLINPYSEYYYSNIRGLKTGSSLNAGKCLVSAANINNKTYICVVMNSSDEGRWLDSLYLYQYIK